MNEPNHSQSGITSTKTAELSANIDWISATFPYGIIGKWRSVVLPVEAHEFIETKAHNGYRTAYQHTTGATVEMNDDRQDMGIHVTYSATAIRNAAIEFNVTQAELLRYLMIGSKLTRLDVAFNIANVAIDIEQLYSDVRNGKVKTRAKKRGFLRSGTAGNNIDADTVYIGSWTKRKKLLRVYDKGTQLGLDTLLTRFELETHGAIAQNAGIIMRDKTEEEYPKTIAGMISAYADFTDTAVGAYMTAEAIKLAVPSHVTGNTAKWLLEAVAPTLARQMVDDRNIWFDFQDAVFELYNAIVSTKQGTG